MSSACLPFQNVEKWKINFFFSCFLPFFLPFGQKKFFLPQIYWRDFVAKTCSEACHNHVLMLLFKLSISSPTNHTIDAIHTSEVFVNAYFWRWFWQKKFFWSFLSACLPFFENLGKKIFFCHFACLLLFKNVNCWSYIEKIFFYFLCLPAGA